MHSIVFKNCQNDWKNALPLGNGVLGAIETDKAKTLEEAHSFARFSDIPGSRDEKVEIPVTLRFPGETEGMHGGADLKMMRSFIKCIIDDTKPLIDVEL